MPHHVPAHVFHLAQLAAFNDLRDAMAALPPINDMPSYIDNLVNQLADSAWNRYCLAAMPNGMGDREYRKPNHILFNTAEGVPVTVWNQDTPEMLDAWGMFLVTPENSQDIVPLTLSSPFNPVNRGDLPPDTVYIEITDARHSALAILVEILQGQKQDVVRLIDTHAPPLAWRQMQVLRSWYASVSSTALEYLPRDQLRDWNPYIDAFNGLNDAMISVSRTGLTILAQKALAFSALSKYFTHLLDAIDDQFGKNPLPALQAFNTVLTQDLDALNAQICLMNANRLTAQGFQPERYDYFVSFADNTKDLPSLVAVPKIHFKPDLVVS